MTTRLSVGLVTYRPHMQMLADALSSLHVAVQLAQHAGLLGDTRLVIIDNGNDEGLLALAHQTGWPDAELISGHGNVGFGSGHNLALNEDVGDLHLVLNPDIDLEPEAMVNALRFMNSHPECGILSPVIRDKNGAWAYLCKRYPSVLDLFLRGFMPGAVKKLFARRLARYEMADFSNADVLWDPPIVSGCFMLCRSELLRKLAGFDPRYFLYFEDFDLSLRAAKHARIAAVSAVRVTHYGGDASRKGWRHIRMFGASAWRFFSTHGWRIA